MSWPEGGAQWPVGGGATQLEAEAEANGPRGRTRAFMRRLCSLFSVCVRLLSWAAICVRMHCISMELPIDKCTNTSARAASICGTGWNMAGPLTIDHRPSTIAHWLRLAAGKAPKAAEAAVVSGSRSLLGPQNKQANN